MNDEAWVSDLTPGAAAYVKDAEGNILGLPFWESSVSGCYYNKTLLDELGLKPATTQAEFDALCQAITDAGYTAICWPSNGCSWFYQFGLDPVFADKPENLEKINKNEIKYADIPEVAAMLEWCKNAAEKGWFGDNYLTDGWNEMSVVMGTGEAAMMFVWDTWFYTDFDEGYDYTKEDFALMPVFMNTTDKGTYEGGNLNYVITYGNRSLTDPEVAEPAPDATEPDQTQQTEAGENETAAGEGNTLLYLGIGGVAAVILLAAVLVVVKKKKDKASRN